MMNSKKTIEKEDIIQELKKEDFNIFLLEFVDSLVISEKDKNHFYTVGSKEEGRYIKIPEIGIEVIGYIKSNGNLKGIDHSINLGIDYKDFIINLIRLGLINSINEFKLINNRNDFEKRIGLKLKSKGSINYFV